MNFYIGHPAQRPRGSRNNNTIVLLALLPDPLGKNASEAEIRRYVERIDRMLARLSTKRTTARRGRRSAALASRGGQGRVRLQRSKSGWRACKEQAKYKRGRVAAQHAPSARRAGRK